MCDSWTLQTVSGGQNYDPLKVFSFGNQTPTTRTGNRQGDTDILYNHGEKCTENIT